MTWKTIFVILLLFPVFWGIRLVLIGLTLFSSFLLNVTLFGYILHIGKIRLPRGSFYKCRYADPAGADISASHIEVIPRIPRTSYPCWAVVNVHDYEYVDHECHVTIGTIRITFLLFPVLLGFTSGPWLVIDMDDFRTRCYSSKHTPDWLALLRRDLIATVLNGETIRLDDVKLKVTFSNANPYRVERDIDENFESEEGLVTDRDNDVPDAVPEGGKEGVVDAYAKGWQIVNSKRRMYECDQVIVQLRRDVDGDLGSYQMSADHCSWTKVRSQESYISRVSPLKVLWALLRFPVDLYGIYRDPPRAYDIHLTGLDVTFDQFNIRHNEPMSQLQGAIKCRYIKYSRGLDINGLVSEMIINAVASLCT